MENKSKQKQQVLSGFVTSAKRDKTITVRVERTLKHPKYGKRIKLHKNYHVHDEQNQVNLGDKVEFVSCRPISKQKCWKLSK